MIALFFPIKYRNGGVIWREISRVDYKLLMSMRYIWIWRERGSQVVKRALEWWRLLKSIRITSENLWSGVSESARRYQTDLETRREKDMMISLLNWIWEVPKRTSWRGCLKFFHPLIRLDQEVSLLPSYIQGLYNSKHFLSLLNLNHFLSLSSL